MALETETFVGVELLSVGLWPASGCPPAGCRWTRQDLDELVEASTQVGEGNFRPPVKIGHTTKEGDPASGTVKNLRRVGDKLLGDLFQVPKNIADLIRSGAFPNRSVEIREIEGRKNVLSGLALLGSKLPAVTNLKDIQKMYREANLSLEDDTKVIYVSAQEEATQMDLGKLRELLGLNAEATEESVVEEIGRLMKSAETSDAKSGSEDSESTGGTTSANTKADIAKIKMVQEAEKKFSTLEAKILELETARAKDRAVSLVDAAIEKGKLLPAQKEQALTFALRDAKGFSQFIESQPSVIAFGENGSSSSDNDETSINLSSSEKDLARQIGISKDELLAQKFEDSGRSIPKDLSVRVEKIRQAAMEGKGT